MEETQFVEAVAVSAMSFSGHATSHLTAQRTRRPWLCQLLQKQCLGDASILIMTLKHSMYVLTRHRSNDNPIPVKWLVDSTCKHSRCFFLCLPQQPSLGALKEKLDFAIIITTIKGKIKPERILFMCVVFNVYFARYWTYDICYHLVQPKDVFQSRSQ